MNFAQRLGLFILILISVLYVYLKFMGGNVEMPDLFNYSPQKSEYNPVTDIQQDEKVQNTENHSVKKVKIYILDKTGNIHAVYRECDESINESCFNFAVNELINAPSKWEKSKGFTSEIPSTTKVLSIRESSGSVLVDLTPDFEAGGGAESTYMRVKQLIKTVNSNTSKPVYLYINGKQTNVIGGEGVMIKQPLNERSLDE